MKVFNVKGIVILAIILAVIQMGVGFLISPAIGKIVIDQINKHSNVRITVDRVSVWPVTLSFSFKNLKIFDPDTNERIAAVKGASARLSPIGLLSKRIVFSGINVSGAEIDVQTEPDGTFNIQKLAEPEKEPPSVGARARAWFDRLRGKKDWFSKVYEMFKQKSSKEAIEQKKTEAKEITREVQQLPKGRVVRFKTIRSGYLFEVRNLRVTGRARLKADTGEVDVEKADIRMRGIAFDPERGVKIDGMYAKGSLRKEKEPAGSFDVSYTQKFTRGSQKTMVDLDSSDLDLAALKFIYQDSVPVDVAKGKLSLRSSTLVIDDEISSDNSLVLRDHDLEPKSPNQMFAGLVPMSALCNAMNTINPVKLKFEITGTVENPKFTGFQDSLMKLVKPYLKNVLEETAKEEVQQGIKDAVSGWLKKE